MISSDLYFEHNGQLHIRYCRVCGEYVRGSWAVCMDCIKLYCWKCATLASAFAGHSKCKHISVRGNWTSGVGQAK